MKLCVSAVIFQLFKIITLENCVLTILELNWNQRLGHKKTKLNICHHMLMSSTQLQNWSFHVVERTRTSTKCEKNEICTCKACKNTIFHCEICKFVGFLLPSSSWLLKLPNIRGGGGELRTLKPLRGLQQGLPYGLFHRLPYLDRPITFREKNSYLSIQHTCVHDYLQGPSCYRHFQALNVLFTECAAAAPDDQQS